MIKRSVQNLLHKELSYQIHGAAIEVRKDFGPGHKEKLYQEALAKELKRRNIVFEKEKAIKIYAPKDGQYIGLYRPDFIIDDKIIIEIKAEKFVGREELKRIYDYLRNSEYELAYFINFASPKLFVKRIIFTNDRKPFYKPPINPPNNTNRKPIATNFLVLISFVLVLISGLLFSGLWLFSGLQAEAAELKLAAPAQKLGIGQQFQVDLTLNTEGESINAVEGKVIFPEKLLEVKEIKDGNSIINFWIDKPKAQNGAITFSGITPGGFQSNNGLLFSAVFEAKAEGVARFEINDAKVLLNDGEGTEAKLQAKDLLVAISANISSISWASPRDAEPPEDFKPEIAQDPNMFEGKWFLVFATQDKGTGIDHYEIREVRQWVKFEDLLPFVKYLRRHSWVITESPYVLKDQKLRSYIYVKAVDKAGNERIAVVEPRYPMMWYEQPLTWGIIILLLVVLYIIGKILWTRKSHE